MQSLSSARQSEVKAWEEEITPCEHTLMLEQLDTGHIAQSGLAHCSSCDLKENLWLCLTCGSLGCGRQQFGGVTGGNGHGLAHYEATGHAVSVKLGTITAEGDADIYCYKCNDAKQDPELAGHLRTFGINVGALKKTEKSMTELVSPFFTTLLLVLKLGSANRTEPAIRLFARIRRRASTPARVRSRPHGARESR